ncbi:MAG: hybrid sensor histidine kinase/response regulator [Calothrix sp. CSU_2_0]|nr:hybrid sensor histidine kinase/response regulator [Calothrix sp. CSU_2_0]
MHEDLVDDFFDVDALAASIDGVEDTVDRTEDSRVTEIFAPSTLTNSEINFIDDLFGERTVPQLSNEHDSVNYFVEKSENIENSINENIDLVQSAELNAININTTTIQDFNAGLDDDLLADMLSVDDLESLGAILEPSLESPTDVPAFNPSETLGKDSFSLEDFSSIEVENLIFASEEVDNLEINNLEINNLEFDSLEVHQQEVNNLEIDDLEAHNLKVNNLEEINNPEEINNLEVDTEDTDESANFDELDALLDDFNAPESNVDSLEDDDFAALDALLGNEITPVVAAASTAIVVNAATMNQIDTIDEFGDLEKLLADADQSISTPSTGTNTGKIQRPRAARFEQLMKVSVKHLDDMSNLVGELVVNRNTLEQDQERLRQSLDNLLIQVHHLSDVGARMQELYERSLLEASLLASRKGSFSGGGNSSNNNSNTNSSIVSNHDRGFSELEMDRFTPFHTLSQEMIELIVRVRESASDIDFVTEETERVARQFRQVTTQLQEGLTKARMVPFSQVTDRVKRGVRDNAIKCGKQVNLIIEGQDTLIDKMILEHLTDPLVHMLNNAIAHGVETPEQRQSKGKSAVGTISVRAFHQGNQTVISVSDDGAGIDPEQVKRKALKVGLITPEQVKKMSRIEVYELLFQPNFSTKDKADDLAGRGVGMDVVRTSISEIRGTINTDSTLNKGTNFTIRLPLTLSICKALSCVSDKARIAFAMDGVEDTLDIPVKNIHKNPAGESFIFWRDTQLPFKPLKDLLTLNRQLSRGSVYGGTRDDDMVSVVVIRSGNTLIALQVDQVLSEQEIVIKQFEGPAPKPIGVAGATVLGDGRIMPIVDVLELIDIFQGRTSKQSAVTIFDVPNSGSTESTSSKIDPTVLIVDDSITVRELLSLSFNKAGYRVEQARDGQEAWEKLRSGLPCDIVFCDIEMPRCDGLELLSRIQKEVSLNHLPIAMLTSRGADKHKQMAIDLGASGYFTKPYLEEALLEAAARMLKGEKLVGNG